MDFTLNINRLRREYFSTVSKVLLLSSLLIISVSIALVATTFFAGGMLPRSGSARISVTGRGSLPLRVKNGAVATGNTICNEIAVEALKEGGNAVDAAVAAAICLGARNCFASGIGGGAVMLLYTKDRKMIHIDGREVAPFAAYQDMLLQNGTLNSRGGLAVAVPGEIKLLDYIFHRYGSKNITWSRLLEPTINFTRNGFPVHRMLERNLDAVSTLVLADPEMASVFAPNGTLLREGDIVKMPKLSNTLELIARNGSFAMYGGGWLTQTMVKEINAQGGVFTLEDIQDYSFKIRSPVKTTFQNLTINGPYPPISGGVSTVMALNILENFDLKSMGINAKSIHLVVEALKFSFAHRLDLGDPDFVDITNTITKMLDKNYAKTLAAAISLNATHEPAFYWPQTPHKKRYVPEDKGTTHISIVDKDRNVISLTTTINAEFGSCFMGPETGIIYNNQMDDFSSPGVPNYYGLAPSDENFIAPRKRPVSSMTPLIITSQDGAPIMTIGGTGGPRIFTNVLQSVLNILIWNKNIKASTLMPRYHHQLIPNALRYENDNPLPEVTIKQLKSFGHKMITAAVGVVNGVHILEDGAVLEAASDWRKYANAAGY